MFSLQVEYPSHQEEIEIVKRNTAAISAEIHPILHDHEVLDLQKLVRRVPVAEDLVDKAVCLASLTRPGANETDFEKFIRNYVAWGAGPRASYYLTLAAKARAILLGRYAVAKEDLLAVINPVLRHRIVLTFRAEADGVTSEQVIERVVEQVEKKR
jgi:MoxR-like ATPase